MVNFKKKIIYYNDMLCCCSIDKVHSGVIFKIYFGIYVLRERNGSVNPMRDRRDASFLSLTSDQGYGSFASLGKRLSSLSEWEKRSLFFILKAILNDRHQIYTF
ncbi:hypothetical protein PIPA1_26960 [Pelosinus sp. IPA-1]|nr:hypothetical protein PIPA1_26960 [Pelosinus sp. IPA-1]